MYCETEIFESCRIGRSATSLPSRRLDCRDLHRHARLLASGQPGADLEPEQTAAEQRVGVAVLVDHLRHRVDDRLREALGPLGAEHLGGAVGAERLAQLVGQVVSADDDRMALAADLRGARRPFGDGAERVLVERALVMKDVGQNVCHR